MPQASEELRAKWGGEHGVGEDKAYNFLISKGWTEVGNGFMKSPHGPIGKEPFDEFEALLFLIHEWDFSFYTEDQMTKFVKMRDRSDGELQDTISAAIAECKTPSFEDNGLDFWKICAGVDAYFEARRRKESATAYGESKHTPTDPDSPAFK